MLEGGAEEFAGLEDGHQSLTSAVRIEEGQDADAFFVHDREGFEEGGIGVDADDVALHDVSDFRGDIGDEPGGGHPEGLEDEIDSAVDYFTVRELFVEYDRLPWNGYVRAGRITKPYGWRLADLAVYAAIGQSAPRPRGEGVLRGRRHDSVLAQPTTRDT